MLNFNFKLLLSISITLFCYSISPVKGESDNSFFNKSIETPNFKIIYNENSSLVAQKLSQNIERWGDEVYTFLGQKPQFKITVFLSNDSDLVNSFSAFTIVSLYLNNNSYSYNEFGNHWLENTFKHELAHNVTRIYDYGFWGGRVFSAMREVFIPTWMHEGTSVLVESKVSKEGRLNNPTFWAKERFLVNNNLNSYFYYENEDPYLDGSSFYNFYYDKYGKEKSISSYGKYSSRPIYELLISPITYFSESVSKDNDDLLEEWQNSLKNRYSNQDKEDFIQGEEIKLKNYLISDLLGETKEGNLIFSASKKNILTNRYEKYIVKINDQGEVIQTKLIDNKLSSTSYNIVDDSITFTKLSANNFKGSLYNNAYSTNMGIFSGTKKIGDTRRSYKLVKGKDECYYHLVANNEKTALLDCNNNQLVDFSENEIIEHLRYNENKNILYFVAGKLDETVKYIYTYDLENKKLNKIIEGLDPYIKDDILYFSYAKSPDGIFNIYEYDLNAKQLKQVTDTQYGAFSPVVIGNNLYYVSFSKDKDGFVISSIFYYKMNPFNARKVNTYSNYEIDKIYDNKYIENHSNSYENKSYIYKEQDNNYPGLIFQPSLYSDFKDLSINFLLGTGKHNLSFGLFESNPFISFSKNNLITMVDSLYAVSFFGEREKSQNVGVLDFNPILLNGYGYLPTIIANTEINTLGGGFLGGALVGNYSTLSYSFKKPKTSDTRLFGYSEIKASYSIFDAKVIQVEGNGEILYGMNPFNDGSSQYIWKKSSINSLYMLTATIPFNMYVYKGMKTGYLGYSYLTVSPKVSYIYSNDSLNNYSKTLITGVNFSNHVRITPNINLGLDITLYQSKRENIKNTVVDKGTFFSITL